MSMVVWVLRYGPQANHEAIVQIKGIDHPWDGRIQKMRIETSPRGLKYVAGNEGNRHDVLLMEDAGLEVAVPGVRRAQVSYDKVLSAQGNRSMFLTEYMEQK